MQTSIDDINLINAHIVRKQAAENALRRTQLMASFEQMRPRDFDQVTMFVGTEQYLLCFPIGKRERIRRRHARKLHQRRA
jgi:hypothetical protein